MGVLDATDEESQSTQRDLGTANGELPSDREESATVNEELQNRNAEPSLTDNDLANLLAAAEIPIIMVGSDLCIRRATPVAEKLFNILPSDIGRPIGHLRPNVQVPDLATLITEAVNTLSNREREVQDQEGRWYSLRVRPYRTVDNRIDGAVLTLLDIDALKAGVSEPRSFAEAIVDTLQTPFLVLDDHLKVSAANRAFYAAFQVSREETENQFIYDLGNGQWNIPKLRELLEEILPKETQIDDFVVEHVFPDIGEKVMVLNARAVRQRHGAGHHILLAIEDITEAARDAESSRRSRAMFERLFESSPDAIVTTGKDGRIARVNLQVETIFGYGRAELEGQPVEMLLPERFRDVHPSHRQAYQLDPKVRPMGAGLELYGRRKDGSVFPVDVMLSPLETEEGTLILAVIRDITERKRAESALRESEARTRTIIESAHDAFVAMSPEGVITDWNQQAEVIFGWSREEAIGKSVASTIIPVDQRAAHERGLKVFAETGEGPLLDKRVEMRALHRDGHEFPVELIVTPLRVEGGLFFAAFIRDISQRKQAEEALRESEKRLHSIMDSSPSIIFVKDHAGHYLYANPQFQKLTSLSSGEVIGKTDAELFPREQAVAFRANDALVLRAGRPMGFEERALQEDGIHTSIVTKFPLRDVQGKTYGTCGIVTDITERQRAEEALRLLVEVTAAASEAEDARSMTANCLEVFCRVAGWQVAQAWFHDERAGLIRCDARAFFSETNVSGFRKASLEKTYKVGEGVIGRMWKSARPQWIADLAAPGAVRNYVRRSEALESGLRSVLAMPIGVGQSVHAIWEFCSTSKRPEDRHFAETARRLGNHLAIVYERKLAEKMLSDLSSQLMKSQDEERRRIARELHDSTAQALAAVGMNLAAMNHEAKSMSPRASRLLFECAHLVNGASDEVRMIAHLLHPPALDQVGLGPALRWYIDGFTERSGIRVEMSIPQNLGRLPQSIETALFRIVQESLSNVHHHSKAKRAEIRISRRSGEVALEVTDHGKGLPERLRDLSSKSLESTGLGIVGMRERVKELGGRFEIRSGKAGTTVRSILPVRKGKQVESNSRLTGG